MSNASANAAKPKALWGSTEMVMPRFEYQTICLGSANIQQSIQEPLQADQEKKTRIREALNNVLSKR